MRRTLKLCSTLLPALLGSRLTPAYVATTCTARIFCIMACVLPAAVMRIRLATLQGKEACEAALQGHRLRAPSREGSQRASGRRSGSVKCVDLVASLIPRGTAVLASTPNFA